MSDVKPQLKGKNVKRWIHKT